MQHPGSSSRKNYRVFKRHYAELGVLIGIVHRIARRLIKVKLYKRLAFVFKRYCLQLVLIDGLFSSYSMCVKPLSFVLVVFLFISFPQKLLFSATVGSKDNVAPVMPMVCR